jgi:phosphorylcholine metabolism protein LicD
MVKKNKNGITDPELIQKIYEIMFVAHNILMKFCIQYWVSSGTLLGAVRHKGIIPWDEDLDVEMSEKYKPILDSREFKAELKKYGFSLYKHELGWYKFRDDINNILVFDIFFTKEKTVNGKKVIALAGKAGKLWPKQFWYEDELFPLKSYKFSNFYVLGPNNPKEHLDRIYGESWKTVGYITLDPDTHDMLDEPIKVKVNKFVPARKFYKPTEKQLLPPKSSIINTYDYYKHGYKLYNKIKCLKS